MRKAFQHHDFVMLYFFNTYFKFKKMSILKVFTLPFPWYQRADFTIDLNNLHIVEQAFCTYLNRSKLNTTLWVCYLLFTNNSLGQHLCWKQARMYWKVSDTIFDTECYLWPRYNTIKLLLSPEHAMHLFTERCFSSLNLWVLYGAVFIDRVLLVKKMRKNLVIRWWPW